LQKDLNVAVMIKAGFTGNGPEAILQVMKMKVIINPV